jgi:4-amino-4-deoxy-L-arabinose transferase-like glycosyltransferase
VRTGGEGEVIYDCAQAHHPPAYYALVGGLHALTARQPGLLTAIGRGVSILAGLASLLLMRAAMHRILPGHRFAIAAGLAIAAASPTFTYMMGSFNNEPLAVLAVCAAIYLGVRALRSPRPIRWLLALGVVLGLGMLVKLTAAVIVVPVLAAGVGVARRDVPGAWRRAAWGTAAALAIGAILVAPWFVRNYMVVGTATFNCAPRPPMFNSMAEVVWQPEASLFASALGLEEIIAGSWWPEWLLREHHTMLADLLIGGGATAQTRPLWMILLPMAIGLAGLGGTLRELRRADLLEIDLAQRHGLWMLLLLPALATVGILHQAMLVDGHILRWAGRYVPVAIPAVSMVVGFGLVGLLRERWRAGLTVAALVLAAGLNSWAAVRIIDLYHRSPGAG